jgi:hypothetical protein
MSTSSRRLGIAAAAILGIGGSLLASGPSVTVAGGQQVTLTTEAAQQQPTQSRTIPNVERTSERLHTGGYGAWDRLGPTNRRSLYTYWDGARGINRHPRKTYVHTPKHLRRAR